MHNKQNLNTGFFPAVICVHEAVRLKGMLENISFFFSSHSDGYCKFGVSSVFYLLVVYLSYLG